jgi:hypothetical protein
MLITIHESLNHATMHGHIAQWQASDLSQAAYCKEHGVKRHIFSYYKKKFCSASQAANPTGQLIPVKLVADDDATLGSNVSSSFGSNSIKLTHANGFSLEINSHTDMASLKPLLELLRSVS